jgi:3',5'-cyclic AMP phosphodiesterase CpdA
MMYRKQITSLLYSVLLLACALHAQVTPSKEPLRFAVMGDTGTGGSAQYDIGQQIQKLWKTSPFQFVLMVGDNMYGSEGPKDFVKKFEQPYKPLLDEGVKFYASLGNHDDSTLQRAYKPFNMNGERYYTVKPRDDVRIFALDSNYMDKPQLEWFEKELKASGSAWKIVFFHHPIYSSGEKHGSNVELRSFLEPLFQKYGVDVVFSGHEHFYERLKPQKNIQYFIVGSSAKLREGNIAPTAITAKGIDNENVFLSAEIVGDEMRFRTISRKGVVLDSGSFKRAEKRMTATAP